VLDSDSDTHNGSTLYDCLSVDGVLCSLWLLPGEDAEDVGDELVVEATLRVLYHPIFVAQDGTRFEAFTEYRLTGRCRCR
jgi:hypothetical protein